MSADRTLMSIIRTALSLIAFGFTIFHFLRFVRESLDASQIVTQGAARNFSIALVALGILLLAAGIAGHVRFMLELRADHARLVREGLIPEDRFPYSVTLAAAVLLLVIGLFAILSMVVRAGPFQ